jgi:heptosyltransferase-2
VSIERIVVRFSSMGDVVLAGAVCSAFGGGTGFLTLPRYAELAARLIGVEHVFTPGDVLPDVPIIDLQNSVRSRWLLRGRSVVRVDRQDLRRRLRVAFKTAPGDRVIDRYARAAGVVPASAPWLPEVARGDVLLIAPGAAHATKRWPYWEALASAWPGPVRALGGPGDEARVDRIGGVCEAGFSKTLDAMNGAFAMVAGDTGLLHLAAAVGLPVVGIFGPTTSVDGFWCHNGVAIELPLTCRPCSRFGGARCPMGDHLCMRGIEVERVIQVLGGLR